MDRGSCSCTRRATLQAVAAACLSATLAPDAASSVAAAGAAGAPAQPAELQKLRELRRRFQGQELITARRFSFVCNPGGEPPQIVWRDAHSVRELGCTEPLRVRWFDRDLREAAAPDAPGRWGAVVEGVAPNGTPLRRSFTFFCRPPGFFVYVPVDARVDLSTRGAPAPQEVWREHKPEAERLAAEALMGVFNDTEQGAALLAGLSESSPLGRPPKSLETTAARDQEFHLSLKLRLQRVKPVGLKPPHARAGGAAPVLRDGTARDAGTAADAKKRIEKVCRAWAADGAVPFATLVARRGVIVTHAAFGDDPAGRPVTTDHRSDVASISKSLTAILFSQFLDQGLARLDDPVSIAFPEFRRDDPHVPTFRQCLTHTSGLSGHSEWGGFANPHLENVILNGIDAVQPGTVYEYSGMGYDLVAKAMEMLGGKSLARLFADHLLTPLGLGDMPVGASAGTQPTARQLATFAQLLLNAGSYGPLELFSRETFESLLPEDLAKRYPGIKQTEGIGMHWTPHARPADPKAGRPGGTFFSQHTIGHGALSGCMFLADLDRGIVVAQVRRETGPRYNEWVPRFFDAITQSLL